MALLFTALLGGGGVILGYFIYTFGDESFIAETERAIDTDTATIIALMDSGLDSDISMILESNRVAEDVHTYYMVLDANNQWLNGNLASIPPEIDLIDEGIMQFDLDEDSIPPAYSDTDPTVAAKVQILEDGRRLVVSRQIGESLRERESIRNLSILVMGLMGAVIVVSFLLSLVVVSKINRISQLASRIMETGDLSQRISVNNRWDDLSNLADILNQLLAQIETLMLDVRQVSDSIAHDLRTPLSRLRHRLEYLEKRASANGDEESVAQVETLIQESDHLLDTFAALLRIANIESGTHSTPTHRIDLTALMSDVEELYRPLAEDKEIELVSEIGKASCLGDENMLFQMFANLMDNAIKFTPKNGRIEMSLKQVSRVAEITIADSGPGIPDSEREKVFTRFYRTDQSRKTKGNGLGLSLVAAVVKRHKGSIALSGNKPGLRVEIELCRSHGDK